MQKELNQFICNFGWTQKHKFGREVLEKRWKNQNFCFDFSADQIFFDKIFSASSRMQKKIS